MAKTIQVRDVDDAVHGELRRRAAAAGVSLSRYVADELERVAARSSNAEILMRSVQRDWAVPSSALLDALDEGRAER